MHTAVALAGKAAIMMVTCGIRNQEFPQGIPVTECTPSQWHLASDILPRRSILVSAVSASDRYCGVPTTLQKRNEGENAAMGVEVCCPGSPRRCYGLQSRCSIW